MCGAKSDVRFTPNSDRKSGHAAKHHVRFTPEATIDATRHKAEIQGQRLPPLGDEHGRTRQNYPDLGELARLGIDLD